MERKNKGKGCCMLNPFSGFNSSKVVLSLLSLFMLIALALGVNAFECNVTTSTIRQGTPINISVGAGTGSGIAGGTQFYAEFYLYSTLTANSSSSIVVQNVTNTSVALGINWTFPSEQSVFLLEDNNVYTLGANVWNGTVNTLSQSNVNKTTCSNQSNVLVDRGAPTAPTNTVPSASSENKTVPANIRFRGDVIGANTTACELRFTSSNPGSSIYQMTHSGSECSLTINNVARGDFTYFIRATDGTNISDSASTKFSVLQDSSNVGKRAYIIATSGGGGGSGGGGAVTKKDVGRALGIQSQDKPVMASGTPFSKEGIKKEVTQPELIKTGIGAGSGALVGMAIGTMVFPGIGTIAGAPFGAIVGGFLGLLA